MNNNDKIMRGEYFSILAQNSSFFPFFMCSMYIIHGNGPVLMGQVIPTTLCIIIIIKLQMESRVKNLKKN